MKASRAETFGRESDLRGKHQKAVAGVSIPARANTMALSHPSTSNNAFAEET